MGAIFYISSQQSSDLPELFPNEDIVFHLGAYFLLALSFIRALKNTSSGIKPSKLFIWTVLFCVIYGVLDEFHQSFVPTRCPSGFDVFIDAAGSLIGSLVYQWIK